MSNGESRLLTEKEFEEEFKKMEDDELKEDAKKEDDNMAKRNAKDAANHIELTKMMLHYQLKDLGNQLDEVMMANDENKQDVKEEEKSNQDAKEQEEIHRANCQLIDLGHNLDKLMFKAKFYSFLDELDECNSKDFKSKIIRGKQIFKDNKEFVKLLDLVASLKKN